MKLEELTQEQLTQARKCTTKEEIMAFIQETQIELSAEQMERISGSSDRPINRGSSKGRECSASPDGDHYWVYTGNTRPGSIWGNTWPDYLHKCKYCQKEDWKWFK